MTPTNATQIDTSQEEQHPRRQTLCGVLRREGNWKCLLLTLAVAGCVSATIWCHLTTVTREVIDLSMYPIKRTLHLSPCASGYAYAPAVIAALLYLVYLVECYHSTARIQLARRVDVAAVALRVRAMRDAAPRVWWKAVCYHYVRRKRQVTRYRNGDAYHTTQVYYERVNTHTASASFAHACCGHRDASRRLVLDARPPAPVTKLRLSKGFAFDNIEAANDFEDQRSRFFAEHERYDDFMEMREGLDLVGVSSFKEYMVAYRDPENIPWYSSQLFFWIVSSLLLSWPLRIIIECNTAYVHHTITKIFGKNYEHDPNQNVYLENQLSELTPTVNHNYNRTYRNITLDAEHRTATIANPVSSCQNTSGLNSILALEARNRSSADRGEMSQATTIDSLELFATIRENCAMIPSYSEVFRTDETPKDDIRSITQAELQMKDELKDRSQQTSQIRDQKSPVSAVHQFSDPKNKFASNNVINIKINKVAELGSDLAHAKQPLRQEIHSHPNSCDNKPTSIECYRHEHPSLGEQILGTVRQDDASSRHRASSSSSDPNNLKRVRQYHICCCHEERNRPHMMGTDQDVIIRRDLVVRKEQNRRSWAGFRSNYRNAIVSDVLLPRASSRSIPHLHGRQSSIHPLRFLRSSRGSEHCPCNDCAVSNRRNYPAIESEIYEANGITESIDRNIAVEDDLPPDTTLYHPSALSDFRPRDLLRGRSQTSPTREPPTYEEAMQMPVWRRITRSLTDRGEVFGQSRAFITDTIMNRRSCIDSVVSAPEGVRLLEPADIMR